MRLLLLGLLLTIAFLPAFAQQPLRAAIDSAWEFRRTDENVWRKATVPGTVHTDLLAHQLIPDPFAGANEKGLQWIDKKDWEYRTSMLVPPATFDQYDELALDFSGLDTYADVYLNDQLILQTGNMFVGRQVPVKSALKPGLNHLRIYFHSPIAHDMPKFMKDRLVYPAGNDADDIPLSVYARKAPYHYGWDWGPRYVTSGIWRPVYFVAWNKAQLKDVWIKQQTLTDAAAQMEARLKLDVKQAGVYKFVVQGADKSFNTKTITATLSAGANETAISFTIPKPKRWWPNGLGTQHLYPVTVSVVYGKDTVQQMRRKIGLRTVEVVNEKDDMGTSFYVKVNGHPVFMKGANYIPSDNFLPRTSRGKYRKMFEDMQASHFNMIRVWGGGIYENDQFYELADEKGILVWQDFMFACTLYPSDKDFLEQVKEETAYNITRLRNHPSLALWCGNNEIAVAIKNWGWKEGYAYTDEQWQQMLKGYDTLFLDILKNEVQRHDPGRFYFPSSPISNWGKAEDFRHGDNHYWGVWHGMEWFEALNTHVPRFMSEYGFQSFPELNTVRTYADSSQWNINSFVMQAHQKSFTRGNAAIKTYMDHYYREPRNFPAFLYLSQVLQAEGMKVGMEAHRRNMPFCMGTLYWQFNDCWPGASWSGIDYFGRWKALQYFVKEAYKPILVSNTMENGELKTFVINDLLSDEKLELVTQLIDTEGKVLHENTLPLTAKANTSKVVLSIRKETLLNGTAPEKVILYTKLVKNNQPVSENVFYFVAPRDLQLPEPVITTHVMETEGKISVRVSTDKLAKNVCLLLEDDNGVSAFSDNYFDLLPGVSRTLTLDTRLSAQEVNKQLRILHIANACK
ncbi:glycoside hydrolase family 2 protein [Chitinophaga sp. GCM10012297]|uniref:Beta-mannosidase B n=1 Tax=Chitinophaga chungangae TaxID=2821488 RepID=A0ABS3YIY8_9BACT|nr:glycoside hydrolase family 2 protein [Chitinophaga chungangae]MBO9154646.1 glycoside hydrolase family 2 protein [Chitinophaga chungangae]